MKYFCTAIVLLFMMCIPCNINAQSISVGKIHTCLQSQNQKEISKILTGLDFKFENKATEYNMTLYTYRKIGTRGIEVFSFGYNDELFSVIYNSAKGVYSAMKEKMLTDNFVYSYSYGVTKFYESNDMRIGLNDANNTISFFVELKEHNLQNRGFNSQKDAIKYNIENVGNILISPKLELQSGDYKQGLDNYLHVRGERISFQQKGLNEFNSSSFNTYVRLLIETTIGIKGDYEKLNGDFEISTAELNELSVIFKQQVLQQLRVTDMKLHFWYGTSIERINNQVCIKYSYVRQHGDNPPVEVATYIFQNNDRMHTITISCRKVEKDIWWPILMKSLNSFKITNIR